MPRGVTIDQAEQETLEALADLDTPDYETLSGTDLIPDELNVAIREIDADAQVRATRHRQFTIYDEFGIPSKAPATTVRSLLRPNPETGKPLFYPRPPATVPLKAKVDPDNWTLVAKPGQEKQLRESPVLVATTCPICLKELSENPYEVKPSRGDLEWRAQKLAFNHGWARHRSDLVRIIRDKELREEFRANRTGGR